jgi:hypothetical protein
MKILLLFLIFIKLVIFFYSGINFKNSLLNQRFTYFDNKNPRINAEYQSNDLEVDIVFQRLINYFVKETGIPWKH